MFTPIEDGTIPSALASSPRWTMIAAVVAAVGASLWMSVEFAAKGLAPAGQVVRVVLPLVVGIAAVAGVRWTRVAFIALCVVWAVTIIVPVMLAASTEPAARLVRGTVAVVYGLSAWLAWISTERVRPSAPNT